MFADYTYRLGPRRMIHELFFDLNFSGFFTEAKRVLAQDHDTCVIRKEVIVQSKSNETLNYIIHVANEQRKAELSNTAKNQISNSRNVIRGVHIDIGGGGDNSTDKLSPTRYELRSPPLSSVQEELASNENLLANETQTKTEVVSTIKTLDSLKLSYKENKFPIRERGDSRNSTK